MSRRRVVITGLGVVSPLGLTVGEFWQGLLEGRCGIGVIGAFDASAFPCRLAGEVPEYKIRDYVPKSYRKATKLMSRDIELSVIAADEAFKNAGVTTKASDSGSLTFDPTRLAISFGAGLISCDLNELAACAATSVTDGKFDLRKWGAEGMENLTPLWLLKYLPNMLPCHVGIIHDIQGPSNTITCGEVSSHIAIAEAAEMIQRGDADAAVGGGAEAKVNPIVMLRQCLLGRSTTQSNETPKAACRPFDAAAAGAVFGEAGGAIVLEELTSAQRRNAPILAEFAGAASGNSLNADLRHLEPDGTGLAMTIEAALAEANITPEEIDLIIPTGTAILQDDRAEATALERVFGNALDTIDVWAVKGMTSHTGAAAGVLETAAAIYAAAEDKIGPSRNAERSAEGCRLKLTQNVVEKPVRNVLCCGYSFGGQTAAIIIKKFEA
ncbi:MAG TPA: beta-ketoacyl-[acyl-carrier-protein] synthase family protein [Phycisphaerales bacterium]|nr:beta-ketoacyl-[acyl-carrier-protein] synthase family protein [Phycisphaerales bacterium]